MMDQRVINQKQNYDVIVVGGGIAGLAAAVASARGGAHTLLMEKSIVLGGLATAGLINWYEPLCDGKGNQMIGGIAEELIRLSVRYGLDTLPKEWLPNSVTPPDTQRFSSIFSPTLFAMTLDTWLRENQVDIVLDCLAVYPVMEQKRCVGIMTEVKEGRAFYGAQMVVDASGDAGIFHNAGAPTVNGKNYLSYVAHGYTADDVAAGMQSKKMMVRLRKWLSAGSDMVGNGQPDGQELVAGLTSEEITDFVMTGRRMLFEKLKTQNKDSRDVSMLPFMPQLRTIRRIKGAADFCAVDRLACEHSIGSCGDFRPSAIGNHYHIPLEALYCPSYPNLIAAGRMISSPYGDGWEAARVIPVCALTGEAAGTAAALAVKTTSSIQSLAYGELRNTLEKNGVLFMD